MRCPHAAIFDLDNTLARSFEAPEPEITRGLERIMHTIPVAVMSAASLERMKEHLLPGFSKPIDMSRLYLFPINGAACFVSEDGVWRSEYHFEFTPEERAKILKALGESVEETGIGADTPKYGEQIVDYDGYIAFTALGLGAPREEKLAWDPEGAKRRTLRGSLQKKILEFDVYIGGTTSIDIMCKGVNKAYAVHWLAKRLGVAPGKMLFVGDALYPGGNDAVVIPTGVETIQVAGPHETVKVIDDIATACAGTNTIRM